MEHLQKQNEALKTSYKFWRTVSLAAILVSIFSSICFAGDNLSLRMQLRTQEEVYQEELAKEEKMRIMAVQELGEMALRLADMEKEYAIEQREVTAVALADAGPELEYLGEFTITAYCCEKYAHICNDGDWLTATGIPVEPGIVAVDPDVVPLGSRLVIDGQEYIAADTGGAICGRKIDICMDTHASALEYGVQTADVYIVIEHE